MAKKGRKKSSWPTKKPLREVVHVLFDEWERLMSTAADLQAAVDTLKAEVADLQTRVAAAKPLISQAQLDANTADVAAAAAAVKAVAPVTP